MINGVTTPISRVKYHHLKLMFFRPTSFFFPWGQPTPPKRCLPTNPNGASRSRIVIATVQLDLVHWIHGGPFWVFVGPWNFFRGLCHDLKDKGHVFVVFGFVFVKKGKILQTVNHHEITVLGGICFWFLSNKQIQAKNRQLRMWFLLVLNGFDTSFLWQVVVEQTGAGFCCT